MAEPKETVARPLTTGFARASTKYKLILSLVIAMLFLSSLAIGVYLSQPASPFADVLDTGSHQKAKPVASDLVLAVDDRLGTLEQSLSELTQQMGQLSAAVAAKQSARDNREWVQSSELAEIRHALSMYEERFSELQRAISAQARSVKNFQESLFASGQVGDEEQGSALPVDGLQLLSVAVWDDGLIAIVGLGGRRTGLSVGDYIVGLKVEAMSVEEQTLDLYQPSTQKFYQLKANSIVYKEVEDDY